MARRRTLIVAGERLHIHTHSAYPHSFCISTLILRIHTHSAYPHSFCVYTLILRIHAHSAYTHSFCVSTLILRIHTHSAYPHSFCVSTLILRIHLMHHIYTIHLHHTPSTLILQIRTIHYTPYTPPPPPLLSSPLLSSPLLSSLLYIHTHSAYQHSFEVSLAHLLLSSFLTRACPPPPPPVRPCTYYSSQCKPCLENGACANKADCYGWLVCNPHPPSDVPHAADTLASTSTRTNGSLAVEQQARCTLQPPPPPPAPTSSPTSRGWTDAVISTTDGEQQ
jgi:hypothetical protein